MRVSLERKSKEQILSGFILGLKVLLSMFSQEFNRLA